MPNQFLSPEGNLEKYFVTEYQLIDQYIGDTLLTWGQNANGQLGINNTVNRNTPVTTSAGGTNWKQVNAGVYQTAAIKTDGTLWTWGRNFWGQLGDNTITDRSTPVTTFAGGTNWKQVSAGNNQTAAIKTDGTLWTWGYNPKGNLGTNDTTDRSTPVTTFAGGTNWKQVSVGNAVTAAIKTDGTLWTWGDGNSGKLGTNDEFIDRLTPVQVFGNHTNWKQVECGQYHIAAIKTDGTLWAWGYNAGRLGINNNTDKKTPVTTFAGGTNWKQVNAGSGTAAIKTDGTLWTWGPNYFGGLGTNDTTQRNTPVTTFAGGTNWKQVSVGYIVTAAIKTDGTLWVWGYNSDGQLGINDTTNRNTPVTTFAGGTNWKQVNITYKSCVAVTSGTDPTFFVS